jgi:mono/diheme cytochrome c family protein
MIWRGRRAPDTAAAVSFPTATVSFPTGAVFFLTASLCLAAEPNAPRYPDGAAAFQANCAVCHGAKGLGQPSLAPPLTTYPARYASIAEGRRQLAMTVLNGMFGGIDVEHKHFDFKMPDFAALDDAALAQVVNFVVFDLSRAPDETKPLTPEEIAAERAHPQEGAAVREHRAAVLAALGL